MIITTCIVVWIIATAFLIASTIYAEYWRYKVRKAKKEMRKGEEK